LTRLLITTAVLLVLSALLLLGGSVALGVGIYVYYARDLPGPNEIAKVRQQFETTLIYDRSGRTLLYQVLDPSGGDRRSAPLAEIPIHMINATIAIEDKSFYENPGFDIRGIVRSVWIAMQGGIVQGGSTITQQLVKNNLFAPEDRTISPDRKIKEIILAGEISRLYSKEQILEWYLNNNFYGNLAYGIDTAAKVYFGKAVRELTLGEAAMLAAIPQNPQLNPLDNPQAARQRQAVVLDSMVALGYITRDEATEAASQVIVTQPVTERYGIIAPHFSLYARRQAEQLLNAQGLDGGRLMLSGGLRVYTTLDLDLQYQTECVMRGYVSRIQGGDPRATPNTNDGKPCVAAQYLINPPKIKMSTPRNVTNAASVVLNPATGEILSMAGSIDYWNVGIDGNFNVAISPRQPGSAFKPIVYVTAFSLAKYMPATMVADVPTTFDNFGQPYTPRNEDGQFHGLMSVREALANSYNIPTVQVLANVGIGQVIRGAHRLGINTLNERVDQYGLSLALGSGEVTLLDLSYAYTALATLGTVSGIPVQNPRVGYRTLDPTAILRIEDKDGKILWELSDSRRTFARQNVVDRSVAYLVNNILSDKQARLPAFGPGNALELSASRPAAAKTGTTNDNRDAWTVGYTPQLVAGVWVGNNNNSPMTSDITGATAAAPIWRAIMDYYHARDNLPARDWERPATIVEAPICAVSGLAVTEECPRVKDLFYVSADVSTIPTQPDIYWKRYQINSRTGLIATAATPADLVQSRVFFDYPPETRDWARTAGKPLPPTEYDNGGGRSGPVLASIISPGGLARIRGTLDVRGSIATENVLSYSLAYGAGVNPSQWVSIAGGDPKARGDDILLGRWDTSGLDGLYTLRLNLVLKDNVLQPYTVQVTIDNRPPTVRVITPRNNEALNPNTRVIRLEAEAVDNVEVAYVEFYRDNQLLGTVRDAPYQYDWRIDQSGPQSFYMIVYDAAGNSTQSDTVRVNVPNVP
jgi:membrane peptidoglycan carboxypeptidase